MTEAANGATPSVDTLDLLRRAGSHPIVQGFPEGVIVVFDDHLRYLCAGGQGLALVGLTQSHIEGRTIDQVFPPAVVAELAEPYRRVFAGSEATLVIQLGARYYLHRIAPLREADGTIVAGIGFALDITEARRSEDDLRSSEQGLLEERRRLREAEAIGHSGSWEWDMTDDVITWSDGLFALHNLDPMDFPGGYIQAAARIHPDDRQLVDDALEACRSGDETVRFRYRVYRTGDGEIRWFDSRGRGVFVDGVLVRLVGAVADITDQVSAEAEVIEANAFQQAVIAASPDFTFITDVRTGASIYGSRDKDVLGLTGEQTGVVGADVVSALIHPEDQTRLRTMNDDAASLDDGQVLELRYRVRHGDGTWNWLNRRIVPFRRDGTGSVIEVLGVLRDVTDVVEAEEQLTHRALHDSLTGLPNRALLLDRLTAALERSERHGREIAVLFCDLDGFKRVNDTGGHSAGDSVLIETARRLQGAVREGDTVARVGGDEFVLIVEPWNRGDGRDDPGPAVDRTLALKVADRIVASLRAPISVHGLDHEVTVSVGVTYPSLMALHGRGGLNASDVVEEADAAMYWAKQEGKNRVGVFASDLSHDAALG